jgi:LytS/YehU family sensor histidine kinase
VFLTLTPVLLYWIKDASIPVIITELKKNFIYPLIMAPSGMLLIAAFEFFKHWEASYQKQEKIKAEMMTYKYEALSNQLNPHFLFNSFNVLSSLVLESPELAIKFIDQLGDLYQRVLNNKDKGLIPLAEELDFVRSYIFLLKTRFEDKLDIRIDIHVQESELIAPLVLQLLIENAVKHNIISKAEPLVIKIARRGDWIEISNPIRIKKIVNGSNATGLHNIRQRYSFFTDKPVEISQADGYFIVTIPVLQKEVA